MTIEHGYTGPGNIDQGSVEVLITLMLTLQACLNSKAAGVKSIVPASRTSKINRMRINLSRKRKGLHSNQRHHEHQVKPSVTRMNLKWMGRTWPSPERGPELIWWRPRNFQASTSTQLREYIKYSEYTC
jgi:hypothetical protein